MFCLFLTQFYRAGLPDSAAVMRWTEFFLIFFEEISSYFEKT